MMLSRTIRPSRLLLFTLVSCTAPLAVDAQPSRLSRGIDSSQTTVLTGRVHPRATAAADQGAVADSFAVPGITLYFKLSSTQQAALDQLLAQQQDPTSTNYRKWLTPEQYAAQFGLSPDDMRQVQSWLGAQGFRVANIGRGRAYITFDGTAGQVRTAFHTQIHRYLTNGETHFANASDPALPTALANIVTTIRGLNDYRLKPRLRVAPQYNAPGGVHQIGPGDLATIYDITPLYQAEIDGTGQSLAIVGQTALSANGIPTDVNNYRTTFGLPAINFKGILTGPNPGVQSASEDLLESDLDLELSGAVARNAQIVFVYSTDVITSLTYAIDHAVAPVVEMSYGGCEVADMSGLAMFQQMAQQANAQGMTWIGVTGDQGAADCEMDVVAGGSTLNPTTAENGLAIDSPGSTPEVTAMGGTMFAEGSQNYWGSNNANGNTNLGSALSYIPEAVWNETSSQGLAAGGGGKSIFFPQPSWQTGSGVPNDGVRHIPDISFNAGSGHDGYYVYSQGAQQVGGTSAAGPVMAGVVALLNHYLTSKGGFSQPGVANINPTLYRMAQSNPAAFHDVTLGNNIVPCVPGSPNCGSNATLGFSASGGYDMGSGLGSLDIGKFVTGWTSTAGTSTAVVAAIDQNPVYQQGQRWSFQLTLSEEAGVGATLTGFTINGASYTSQIGSLFGGSSIAANGSISANMSLTGLTAPATVTFVFSGVDAKGNPWTTQMAIPFSGPQAQLSISGVTNAASYQKVYAPGMLISVFGTGLGDYVQSAGTIPLPQFLAGFSATIEGVPTPLYYVSPSQVNIQIPYETPSGLVTLSVNSPWNTSNFSIRVSASAPGIFANGDGTAVLVNGSTINPKSSSAGQIVTIFITGEGKVTPALATGTTPSPRATPPKPQLPYSITVGGVPVQTINFIGIPNGLVGVTQINFTIPSGVPTGSQPIVVTVGSAASPPANMAIQ